MRAFAIRTHRLPRSALTARARFLLPFAAALACLQAPPPHVASPAPEVPPATTATNPPPITPPLECLPSPAAARDPASALARPTRGSLLSTSEAHALLAIDPLIDPYRVHVPGICVGIGVHYVARVEICVSPEGKVVGVKVVEPSIALIDEQLPTVMSRWVYHPHIVAGKPMGFCYALGYRVR